MSFCGCTGLITFLNARNKTIVNVNIGDSLAILKLEGKPAIALNNELDFKIKKE